MSFLEKVGALPLAAVGGYIAYKNGRTLAEEYQEPLKTTLDSTKGYENNTQAIGAGLNEFLYQNTENESLLDTTAKTAVGASLFGYSAYVLAGRPNMTFEEVDNALEE